MNRFLTKKKAKKSQPAPKADLDLATILPSNDNFRTSLLMPNLSARFSMLREQDDPNSKLGKASDDSVLQPKRQSRLHEFGYTAKGLSGIAEVSSTSNPIRPPFVYERQGSVASDGYGTDDDSLYNGSVMSRARPGEGNVLFGGRQRAYKIPVDSAAYKRSASNGSTRGASGRSLHEDDASMSALQKLQEQERAREAERDRERKAKEENESNENQGSDNSEKESTHSTTTTGPARARQRRTSSSTASQPSDTRSSTAATSITSLDSNTVSAPASALINPAYQPVSVPTGLEKPATKAKRLYERGLNQHLSEQKSSATTRLNSVRRQPAPIGTGTCPPQVRSASGLGDRRYRPTIGLRALSPPPSAPSPEIVRFGSGSGDTLSSASPVLGHRQSPLLSSVGSGNGGNVLWSATQPNDRGKATAMGAFNKPKEQFSEHQYLQRQLSLQQGRGQASPTPEPARVTQTVHGQAEAAVCTTGVVRPTQRNPDEIPSAVAVFHNAANRMRSNVVDSQRSEAMPGIQPTCLSPTGSGESEDEQALSVNQSSGSDHAVPDLHSPVSFTDDTAPSTSEHPALRPSSMQQYKPAMPALPQVGLERPSPVDTPGEPRGREASVLAPSDADSPALGPVSGMLNGLVQQHLRNTSNQSSIYSVLPGAPSPLHSKNQERPPTRSLIGSDTPANSSYTKSNPWNLEDFDGAYCDEAENSSSANPINGHQSRCEIANGTLHRYAVSRTPDTAGKASWEFELHKKHSRGLSTETQQEQEAFATELAQRQRAILENLRSKVENELRAPSPVPGMTGALRALVMLRSKSNRDSVSTRQEIAPRAMKMLGIAGVSTNGSSTSLAVHGDRSDHCSTEDDRPVQEPGKSLLHRAVHSRVPHPIEGDIRRELGHHRQREYSEGKKKEIWNVKGDSPSDSSQSSIRYRSSSEVSPPRSRSRSGRFREDFEESAAEETWSHSAVSPDQAPSIPEQYMESATNSPGIAMRHHMPHGMATTTEKSPILRNDSKMNASGYFDLSSLQPVGHGSYTANGLASQSSPRASPGAHSPAVASTRASQSAPNSANPMPPISAGATPLVPVPLSEDLALVPSRLVSTSRKKHVQKSDISEPTLISMTSVVDTVELPPGASLKNGQEDALSVPPVNPRRRRFGFGRMESSQEAAAMAHDLDEYHGRSSSRLGFLKLASEGRGLGSSTRQLSARPSSPVVPQTGVSHSHSRLVGGGMF